MAPLTGAGKFERMWYWGRKSRKQNQALFFFFNVREKIRGAPWQNKCNTLPELSASVMRFLQARKQISSDLPELELKSAKVRLSGKGSYVLGEE